MQQNVLQIIFDGIVLLLFPFMVKAGTFFDNFADGDIEGWETEDVLLEMEAVKVWQKHLLLSQSWQPNEPPLRTWIRVHSKLQPYLWRNYTLQFQFQFTRSYAHARPCLIIYTLLEYFRDPNLRNAPDRIAPINFHCASISMDNRISWSCLDGNNHGTRIMWTEKKVWYSVKIVHNDGQYEFWWDNKLIKQYHDDTWLIGEIRFDVQSCDVLIDNVQIIGENVPNFQHWAVELDVKSAITWGKLKGLK